MTPELSRQVGRVLGLASPPPTLDERLRIEEALAGVDTWDRMPDDILNLLKELKSGHGQRANRLSPVDARYNKAHDKLGKFAAGHGWTSAGSMDERVATTEAALYEEWRVKRSDLPESDVRGFIHRMAVSQEKTAAVVLRNGPHEIRIAAGTIENDPDMIGQVKKASDTLMSVAPVKRMSLRIDPPNSMGGDLGQAGVGVAVIDGRRLAPYWRDKVSHDPTSMPMAGSVIGWKYTLAHEWGHVTAFEANDSAQLNSLFETNKHFLSHYGKKNRDEAVAEAFAEYHLSLGKTKNKAALAYAQALGWSVANYAK